MSKFLGGAIIYADTDDKIQRVVDACSRAFERDEAIGLDTEFYDVEVGKQSCVARARLHLLSIAVARHPVELSPRGFPIADSAVFTRDALGNAALLRLLAGPGRKAVHNLPVDAHTLENEGVRLGDGVNTLDLSRYTWPDRARGPGFGLDVLGMDFCGAGKLSSFEEIFSETVTEYTSRFKRVIACECGAKPCRKRASTPGHARLDNMVETRTAKEVVKEIPLNSVVPGHPRWEAALAYSAQDAILALAIYNLCTRILREKQVEVPWL